MKIQRESLNKYLVRDIEGRDESVYIFPRVFEIDVEEDTDTVIDSEHTDELNTEDK